MCPVVKDGKALLVRRKKGEKMVVYLIENGYADERTANAMRKVLRGFFVPVAYQQYAYADYPLPIGQGQTISAPSIVAFMTKMLDVQPGMKILEIGAGCGYQSSILAELVGPKGVVYSVERVPEMVELARMNIAKLEYNNITVIYGDGTLGYPDAAPYDRIIVTCGAPQVPQPLIDQLKEGGKMLIPVGQMFWQDLIRVERGKGKEIKQNSILPVTFVPLIGKYGHKEQPLP